MKLDRYDLQLIRILRKDGRLSWTKLAEKLNMSASGVQRRVQGLQQAGIIRHYTLALNNRKAGNQVRAFVQVKINRHDQAAAQAFINTVVHYPEVEACHKISGNRDFLLNIVAVDLPQFAQFVENKILYLPSVIDASSLIVLEDIKEYGVVVN